MRIRFATRFNFSGPNPVDAIVVQDSVTGGDRIGISLQVSLPSGSPLWIWTVGGYSSDGWVGGTWPEPKGPWDSRVCWGSQAHAVAAQLPRSCILLTS